MIQLVEKMKIPCYAVHFIAYEFAIGTISGVQIYTDYILGKQLTTSVNKFICYPEKHASMDEPSELSQNKYRNVYKCQHRRIYVESIYMIHPPYLNLYGAKPAVYGTLAVLVHKEKYVYLGQPLPWWLLIFMFLFGYHVGITDLVSNPVHPLFPASLSTMLTKWHILFGAGVEKQARFSSQALAKYHSLC